jgi:hypothetical protein
MSTINKYKNLNVSSIKKKKCLNTNPIKYNLEFKYSTNLSGYDDNYFLYSGKEKNLNNNKKKLKIIPGSLVQYIGDDNNNGKMAIVQKIIKTPSPIEAWQDNKRNPPKSPNRYEIKFLGLDINNPELESNIKVVKKQNLKLYFSYKKEICSNLVPNKIEGGKVAIMEKYNKINKKKYNNVIFDLNDKLTNTLLKKTSIMKKIILYYNEIFNDKLNKIFIPEYIYDGNSKNLIKPESYYRYKLSKSNIVKIIIKNKKSKKSKKDYHKNIYNLIVYVDVKLERYTNEKIKKDMSTTSKIKDSIGNLFYNSTYKLDCNKRKKEIRDIIISMKKQKKTKKMSDLMKKGGRKTKKKRKKRKTKKKRKKKRKKTKKY